MKRYIRSSNTDNAIYALTERHVGSYLDSVDFDEVDYGKMVDYVADMVAYNLKEKYGQNVDYDRVYKQVARIIDDNWDYWSYYYDDPQYE